MEKLPTLPVRRAWVDAGVDYMSASCAVLKRSRRLARIAERLIEEERGRGEPLKEFTLMNWQGLRAGRVQFAKDGHACFMKLEGSLAKECWLDLYKLCDNVSRIDTQVTVQLDEPMPDLASRLEAHALDFAAFNKRRHDVRLIRSKNKGETLYVGDRTSDIFLRSYDRYKKTKDETQQNCWRQEAEVKEERAKRIAHQIAGAERTQEECAAITSALFTMRGVPLLSNSLGCDITCNSRHNSTRQKKLLSLARQWGRFIREEIEGGRSLELFAALSLPDPYQGISGRSKKP